MFFLENFEANQFKHIAKKLTKETTTNWVF